MKTLLPKKANLAAFDGKIASFNNRPTDDYTKTLDTKHIWLEFQKVLQSAIDIDIHPKMSFTRYNCPWIYMSVRRSKCKKVFVGQSQETRYSNCLELSKTPE